MARAFRASVVPALATGAGDELVPRSGLRYTDRRCTNLRSRQELKSAREIDAACAIESDGSACPRPGLARVVAVCVETASRAQRA